MAAAAPNMPGNSLSEPSRSRQIRSAVAKMGGEGGPVPCAVRIVRDPIDS